MNSQSTQRTVRSAIIPALVAAIQLVAVTWVPFVHAELEAQTATAVFEDEHSPDCSETHSETSCASCAASHNISATQVRQAKEDLAHPRLTPNNPAQHHPFVETFVRVHTVRAPPIR